MSEHVTQLRVRYADTDKAGVVYYANYLAFFEVGRTELMRTLGCPYAVLEEEEGVIMPVIEAHVRYQAPAHYDDLLSVASRVTEVRKVRLRIDSRIFDAATGEPRAEGWVWLACLKGGRPAPLPSRLLQVASE